MFSPLRILVVLAVLALLLPLPAGAEEPIFKKGTLALVHQGRTLTLAVEVAETSEARSRGLMFRKTLADNAGMLFVFDVDDRWAFWMKNTLIPLSIAFINKNWQVVDVKDMPVAPSPEHGPFAIYQAAHPARYALEVKQGLLKRKGIGIGARVQFRRGE